jgi:hypothetical protein
MLRRLAAGLATVALAAGLGATVAGTGATPAAAAVPDRWGFAYLEDPSPPASPHTPDLSRQWGSWKVANPGAWADVDIVGFGHYAVRFPDLASRNGVAHVTAVSNQPRWCQIADTYPAGGDQIVEVRCYRHGGAPDWSRFAVMYATSSGPLAPPVGAYGYVRTDPPGGLLHSYNSSGGANLVSYGGPGLYRVHLPGIGTGVLDGNVQVTADDRDHPRRCEVVHWVAGAAHDVLVQCVDGVTGTPADSGFDLTYHRERSVFGGLQPPRAFAYLWSPGLAGPTDFNSLGGSNHLIVSGTGQRLVIFEDVGMAQTHVQVTGFRASPDYCILQEVWAHVGTDVWVRNVICFDGITGARADNQFLVTQTSRR